LRPSFPYQVRSDPVERACGMAATPYCLDDFCLNNHVVNLALDVRLQCPDLETTNESLVPQVVSRLLTAGWKMSCLTAEVVTMPTVYPPCTQRRSHSLDWDLNFPFYNDTELQISGFRQVHVASICCGRTKDACYLDKTFRRFRVAVE